jgi:putative flippase GtrA
MRLLAPLLNRQFGVFLVVGGACAAVNFGAGAAIRMVCAGKAAYAASVAVGFTAGSLLSFVLNRRYTFRVARSPVGPQAWRFTLLSFATIALSAAVGDGVLVCLEAVGPRDVGAARLGEVAHAVTIGLMTVFNFFAMKFFALRAPEPGREAARDPVGVAVAVLAGGRSSGVPDPIGAAAPPDPRDQSAA